jgi:hypothetical protein
MNEGEKVCTVLASIPRDVCYILLCTPYCLFFFFLAVPVRYSCLQRQQLELIAHSGVQQQQVIRHGTRRLFDGLAHRRLL